MTNQNTPVPVLGDPLPAIHPSEETLKLLTLRRSTTAALLTAPGPSPAEMDKLLTIGSRVPDHRRVVPFRFIVFEGKAKDQLGEIFSAAAAVSKEDNIPAPEVAATLAQRAPSIVFVISAVNHAHKTPEWEQILTSGAVCQNMLLGASAMGYAGQWLTEWIAFDQTVHQRLDLTAHERIAGIMYFGTASEPPKERARPDVAAITQRWPTS